MISCLRDGEYKRKSNPCNGNRVLLLLSEWSFSMCLMPCKILKNVLSTSLNKTFPSLMASSKLLL